MQNKNQEEEQALVESVVDFGKGSFFVSPEKIIKIAGIKSGDKVADFGCGAGYFSLPAAKTVGEAGQILAFDVLPSAIEALESRASTDGIDNITVKRVNLEKENGTGLEEESVDWVIVKDVLFQNKRKQNILHEAKRILKKGGNILVMEWNENLKLGPDGDFRIDAKELVEIIFAEGFVFKKKVDAGDYHYVIIATKM
ncbi:MAG: class I SAM-dependent methyltransferase [Candidatus Moraniibacteriota bacterium]